jgi:DNA-binding transcriptional ArsR family regulator
MNNSSRIGHFWSRTATKRFRELFLIPFKSGEKFHLVFFSGYLGPNHYHLYQLVQLAALQKENPENSEIHLILTDVGLHTRRHTDYSDMASHDVQHENENHLSQMKGALYGMGVPESAIHTYLFSDLLVAAFNRRKDLLLDFYRGLSEIQNDILDIEDAQKKKFNIPTKGKYTIGYVIQKYGILFLSAYFGQVFHEYAPQGKVVTIFGDSGRPIIESLEKRLLDSNIIPKMDFSLNLDGIPTFGTDSHRTASLSIPTAGMTRTEIGRIVKAYSVSHADMSDIYEKLIEPVTGTIPSLLSHQSFADDLCRTLEQLVQNSAKSSELLVNDRAGIVRLGSLLRSSDAHRVLALCNGSTSMAEISRTLKKHPSNVSVIIRRLRESGLVDIGPGGMPFRAKKSLKLVFY